MDPARTQDLLERIAHLLRAEVRTSAGAHDLVPVHVEILHYLARCNRYSDTPAAVATWLGVTKGTVSQSVAQLVRRQLVAAFRGTTDRRTIRLRLTRRGQALLEEIVPAASLRAIAGADDRTADVEPALEALLRALQRVRGGATFGVCATCAHFRREGDDAFRCGLTGEPLLPPETVRICREHAPTGGSRRASAARRGRGPSRHRA